MNIPCKIHVNCPGSGDLEFDFPLANFSSEAPDQDLFIGLNYGWDLNLPNLGWTWNNNTGIGVCTSPVSQAVADQCAQNNQLTNLTDGTEFPNEPWLKQNGTLVQTFFNQQQAASFVCPDGLLFTWIVAAGTVNALSLAVANAIAFNIAIQQSIAHYICLGNLTNTATAGSPYNSTVTTTRGPLVKAPLSIGLISGSLPPGLVAQQSVDSLSFIVSGTPTTPGTFNFTLQATDANGNFMQKVYTITVAGSCQTVFANPAWNINTFTGLPPNGTGSGSASGLNFSITSTTTQVNQSVVQVTASFGLFTTLLPYTLGTATTCKLTVNVTASGVDASSIALTGFDINNNQFLLLNVQNPVPLGTSVFSFTIPANIVSLAFQAVVVGGNGVGSIGSINMTGSFGT